LNIKSIFRNWAVTLGQERRAAMVRSLPGLLCGRRDARPVVSSGSLSRAS